MAPSGSWELRSSPAGTHVTLVMAPVPHGLLRPMAPLTTRKIQGELPASLMRLKRRLEEGSEGIHEEPPHAMGTWGNALPMMTVSEDKGDET